MGNVFDALYDVLFQPKIAMKMIAEQKNISQGVIVFFLSLVIPLWALYFGLQDVGMSAMVPFIIGFKIISSMLMWFMGAAVWHLIAEFLGGRGTGLGLFITLGFAQFPQILIVPLWVIAALLPASLKSIMMAAAALIIFAWTFFLTITAIKEVYEFSTAKAMLVIIAPVLAILVVGAIAFTFIGSAMTQMPMWL
ncbi:Yip1 family protein [Pelosinus propionicus]|uniref:Yip1 domain-containing protein n=1 Tax=Pelosinus propionicus DSM 13327 TaxID=1123291 RepID=A0A1I4KEB2_9FIRM|nr:Yip1 family protein [Pelosinus propionicus]SFL76806.1 Yip1 domain-containing protein [Pelosinus propionicus DSM 13327]